MARPILFLKTEWMDFYDGRKGDKPSGKHKYVKKTGRAHEDHNFKKLGNSYYAYAPIAGGAGGVQLKRLGGDPRTEYLDGVDVVFIASAPDSSGVKVVGWYRNARVFRSLQKTNGRDYIARCDNGSQKLLGRDERGTRIENPPRRTAVWYGRANVIAEVRRLMQGQTIAGTSRKGRSRDVDTCVAVEKRAYDLVIEKYETLGYEVAPVWRDKVGWDLEAIRGKQKLRIEVKGTAQSEIRAELTPNEYRCSKHYDSYRICIVTNALTKDARVHAFSRNFANLWYDETGRLQLLLDDRIGARLSATETRA